MKKQKCFNENGLSLVELLAGLAITSLIAILILSNLLSGMKSYKSVNSQISLHDEANYIMTRFVNQFYQATSVKENTVTEGFFEITQYKENGVTTLGFINDKAYINNQEINSSAFSVDCAKSSIQVDQNTVFITLAVKDKATGKELVLNNKVSYVNVE